MVRDLDTGEDHPANDVMRGAATPSHLRRDRQGSFANRSLLWRGLSRLGDGWRRLSSANSIGGGERSDDDDGQNRHAYGRPVRLKALQNRMARCVCIRGFGPWIDRSKHRERACPRCLARHRGSSKRASERLLRCQRIAPCNLAPIPMSVGACAHQPVPRLLFSAFRRSLIGFTWVDVDGRRFVRRTCAR